MIIDVAVLKDVRKEWATVMATRNMIKSNIVFAFAGGGYISPQFRSLAHSMTLLFGFTVLEHVLVQLRDEGHFKCSSPFVGPLMDASKSNITWTNFDLVEEARTKRNEIAHNQQWIEINDTARYLDAIETELKDWAIIESDDKSG